MISIHHDMNIILQELANIVIHVSQSEDVSPECHLWWDASHDVHSPLSEINYSFGQDSCSGVSLSETIFSDCFSPPATQSQHNAELQCHSAELLHDVPECNPEMPVMAPASCPPTCGCTRTRRRSPPCPTSGSPRRPPPCRAAAPPPPALSQCPATSRAAAATQVQILIFLLISCLACNEWPQLTDSARVCQGR